LTPDRLADLIAAIDAVNARDPRRTADGRPVELAHAERLTFWVLQLAPQASAALRVAARGQHIERWTSPRDSQPLDRAGYLRWRENLKRFHAERVAGLLRDRGINEEETRRVVDLITKAAHRAGDPEGVALEDALCLVFFETPIDTLRAKLPGDKMENALRKTWGKMSAAGRARALTVPVAAELRHWLETFQREEVHGRD
jgi:hypothetical protein